MNLEIKCVHHKPAFSQLKEEIERYGNDNGCSGYILQGCYKCDGYNKNCNKYYSTKWLKKEN